MAGLCVDTAQNRRNQLTVPEVITADDVFQQGYESCISPHHSAVWLLTNK